MVYSFAHINAVLEMKVRDYFVQDRRGWVRLHEKGGKEHEVPCHRNLEKYLVNILPPPASLTTSGPLDRARRRWRPDRGLHSPTRFNYSGKLQLPMSILG
jgi:hypothetical protein